MLAFSNNYPYRLTVIPAAGNTGGLDDNNDGSGYIYDIATGYNVITVGSYDDKNNGDSSDDVMSDFSSWKDPWSFNGDREKPDVVAPGSKVRTTGYSAPLIEVNGTSFAAPVVTGGSALLMQRYPNFRYEPEALKAFIIATAQNNIEGDLIPWYYEDSKDGYGAVDFNLADRILLGQVNGGQTARDYYCDSSPNPYVIPINVTNTNIHRFTMTWKVNPDFPFYYGQPNMDLDFTIRDPNGNWVGESGYLDNNVEAEYIRPTIAGTYTLQITRKSCFAPYTYTRIGVAWSEVPGPYTAQYYNNKTLSGNQVVTRKDPKVGFDWGTGSPDAAVYSDGFSARWTKTENFAAGTYEFTVNSDDGIRLFLDNVKLPELDRWFDQAPGATPYKAQRTLAAGNHTIKVEYYENGGGAVARAGYEKVPDVVSGGIYRLTNQCSDRVLDVDGGKTNDGANVQQWGWANVGQQKWKIDSLGGGLYKLTAQHSQKVLEVYGGSTLPLGNVDQWKWLTTNNNFQKWSIQNGGAGFAKLIVEHSKQALDVYNASLNDGADVEQYPDNNTCAQKWKLDKL